MTKEQRIDKLNHLLSVEILLEAMLYSITMDSYDEMKNVNPSIANITRNDIHTIRRSHDFYIGKFKHILSPKIFDDFDNLRIIIEDFIKVKIENIRKYENR